MSTAVMPVVPRFSCLAFVRALVPALALLSALGCPSLSDETASLGEGEGEGEDNGAEFEGGLCGAPVVNGDIVCGGCDFGGGDICGVADEATCEVRENSDGQACQLCITSAGVVLYDDCFRGVVDTTVCESSPAPDDNTVCRTCFDDVGYAVSTSCSPVADRCEANIEIDGRLCNQCYRNGALVSTVCAPTDLDPRRCVAYDNDAGRCVDCYDDDNALIAHDCSPSSDGAACEDRIQGGLLCTVCYDNNGQVAFQECRDDVPESLRCEGLDFSEQSCRVCIDVDGDVSFVSCVDNDCKADAACRADSDCDEGESCFDGLCIVRSGAEGSPEDPGDGECPAPVPCTMTRNAAGDLCRTCATSDGVNETRCMSPSDITCAVLDEAALPVAPVNVVDESPDRGVEAPPTDRPEPQGRSCVLCTDRALGVEVYRDCAGNGAVPPPYCFSSSTVDGDTCSVCFDAVTSEIVHSVCDGDTCFGHADIALHDPTGRALAVDGSAAVVGCKQCSDSTTCALRPRCDDGLTADAAACPASTTLRLAPRFCSNPWAGYRNSRDRDDDLAGLISYALSAHQLVIEAATTTPAPATSCAAESCDCARGDVVEIVVAEADRARAERAFSSLLAP